MIDSVAARLNQPFGWKATETVARDIRPAFAVERDLIGFAVVATDTGRPMTESYPEQWEATEVAERLNLAVADGPRALAQALSAA